MEISSLQGRVCPTAARDACSMSRIHLLILSILESHSLCPGALSLSSDILKTINIFVEENNTLPYLLNLEEKSYNCFNIVIIYDWLSTYSVIHCNYNVMWPPFSEAHLIKAGKRHSIRSVVVTYNKLFVRYITIKLSLYKLKYIICGSYLRS